MTIITWSDRCLNLMKIINLTEFNSSDPQRLKYYELLCRMKSLNLSCFEDEIKRRIDKQMFR